MNEILWQPSTTFSFLKKRAAILKKIRCFFEDRDVLEVDTPLLCNHTVTDPYIESITCSANLFGEEKDFWLQTSPEYAMKRLLASGSQSIYQITKAFRNNESGRFHNHEFTMLEWYRVGFNYHELMEEVGLLLQEILEIKNIEKITYQNAFKNTLSIDPISVEISKLQEILKAHDLPWDFSDRNTCLQILMSEFVEPNLPKNTIVFIYDYPSEQSALAVVRDNFAERFEVYINGVELANGFQELSNYEEQKNRFEANRQTRKNSGYCDIELDEFFLAAIKHGLPFCSGVALGVDRLMMLVTNQKHIQDVISFTIERA